MARWAPERGAVMDALAAEFLQHWRRGRRVLGVDTGGVLAERFAGELGAALERADQPVTVTLLNAGADVDTVRRDLIAPFRAGGSGGDDDDATLLVELGPDASAELRSLADFVVYVESDDRTPGVSATASALINGRDGEHPRRVFADSC